ncbi:MAG: hypothetical protein QGI52_05225, partial [Alphaproteobacteria bacterium]|nr:hypothetical protein [Alphaproteobacteria bacterium]
MSGRPAPTKMSGAPPPWRATVLTLYPDMFPGPLAGAVSGRALGRGIWSLDCLDIRDHAHGKHGTVDD